MSKSKRQGTSVPIALFECLPEHAIQELLREGVQRTYARNSVILSQGDESTSLYIVLAGRLKVYRGDAEGREFILATLTEGDHFGELGVLDESPRSASVATLEPCKLLVLSKASFHAILTRNPELAMQLIERLAAKVRRLTDAAYMIATHDVFARLKALLMDYAKPQGDAMCVEVRLTHQEIASRIGCTREMVSRIMRDLTTAGYIGVNAERRIIVRKKLPLNW